MFVRTTSIPTPRPETSETCAANEKTGQEHEIEALTLVHRIGLLVGYEPLFDRLRAQPLRVHPPPVVGDEDDDVVAFLTSLEPHDRLFRLAGRDAVSGVLDAVIDRIADQVDDRIAEVLDHRLVDLGLLAREHELDVLSKVAREVAGDTRVLLEQPADRLHPRLHHGILQVRDEQIELAHREVERMQCFGVVAPAENFTAQRIEAVLRQADFARQVQDLIEAGRVDANRVVPLPLGFAAPGRSIDAGLVAGPAAHRGLDDLLCRTSRGGHRRAGRRFRDDFGHRAVQQLPIRSERGRRRRRRCGAGRRGRCGKRDHFLRMAGTELSRNRLLQAGDQRGIGARRLGGALEHREHLPHGSRRLENHVQTSGVTLSWPFRRLSKRFSVRWQSVTSSDRIEEARATLDRVKAAEDLVQQAPVVGCALEIHQLVVDPRQQISCFDQEILKEVFHSGEITHDVLALLS